MRRPNQACSRPGGHYGFPSHFAQSGRPAAELGRSALSPRQLPDPQAGDMLLSVERAAAEMLLPMRGAREITAVVFASASR